MKLDIYITQCILTFSLKGIVTMCSEVFSHCCYFVLDLPHLLLPSKNKNKTKFVNSWGGPFRIPEKVVLKCYN